MDALGCTGIAAMSYHEAVKLSLSLKYYLHDNHYCKV